MRGLRVGWLCAASLIAGCSGDDGGGGSGTADGSTGETGAVDTTSGTSGGTSAFCEGPTQLIYDPVGMTIDAFPDDFFTVDADTASGVMVDMRPDENIAIEGLLGSFSPLLVDASTLDGFGTTTGIYLQVTAPLDPATLPTSGEATAAPDGSLVLVDFDADPVEFVPFELSLVAEDMGAAQTTVVMEPLVPLAPTHRHGVAMTTAVTDEAGSCVAPSLAMLEVLEGSAADPALDRAAGRVADFVDVLIAEGTITAASDLTAAVVFTTQHTTDDSEAIAKELRDMPAPAFVFASCVSGVKGYDTCTGTFDVVDYTGEDEAVDDDLQVAGSYVLDVVTYVPTEFMAPHPTMIFGHGLTGDRNQAEELAEFATAEGFAVIAIDAPKHGAHPDGGGIDVLEFFGLSLDLSDPLDALKLRDNFRQATYDRLQLHAMLLEGLDVRDDGMVDLDPDSLHYLGVSLGGLMGPEYLAFAPEIDTATLIVPGARVTGMVRDGEAFSLVVDIFAAMATQGQIARFFPMVQSVVDRGDPGVYARHVVRERLAAGEQTPQLLMTMVIGDDTVPNPNNTFLARALDIPLLGDELLEVGLVEQQDLPTSENLKNGLTAGLFQFDILEDGGTASHGNIARSQVAQTQILRFINSFIADGHSEIIDPYRVLGVKP